MKKLIKIILVPTFLIAWLIAVFISVFLLGCTKKDSDVNNLSLKQAFNQSALNLNTAVSAISSTRAFSIFTINDVTQKSASVTESDYKVYITLDTVKGVYDYKPVAKTDRWGISLIRFFNKTAENSKMIVRMPLKKVTNPRSLRQYVPADSSLTNNFSIAVSDYHNNYNSYHDFDYILASEISIDNAVAGNLDIDYVISPTTGIHYASQYAFTGSYTANYKYESGDTTVSSFAITGNGKVLYEEKRLTIKSDTGRFGREHQYVLTIGDVQITRKSGVKTASVSVNGVLQPGAVVEIVDKVADSEASVCKKRDVQITFEDGTITTVSALIGNSVENIKTLFDSLHQVYFAAYIVDWIAYDIYYQRD
jgi:hypothetical protein